MSVQTNNQAPLNDVEVMLLRLFSWDLTTEELQTIQDMLLDYYNRELHKELGILSGPPSPKQKPANK